jgi:hypothetical protein
MIRFDRPFGVWHYNICRYGFAALSRSSTWAFACILDSFLVMGCCGPYSRSRQPLDPPDIDEVLADLLGYMPAILLSIQSGAEQRLGPRALPQELFISLRKG